MRERRKLLVLGLDGATPELLIPWVREGRLPTFKIIMEKGIYGSLRSTIPPITGAAWPSFMTGKNPGKHGTFDFVRYNPLQYDGWKEPTLVTSELFAGTTFFDLLGRLGYTVAVITVPVTYPVWEVNGLMVAGYPCPDTEKNYIYSQWGGVTIEGNMNFSAEYYTTTAEEKILEDGLMMTERRTSLALDMLSRQGVDCVVMVLGEIDRAQHDFWKYHDPLYRHLHPEKNSLFRDAILKNYQKADWALQQLMKHLDDHSTLVILSDHGGGPHPPTFFHLNRWLRDRGWLRYKHSRSYLRHGLKRIKKGFEKLLLSGRHSFRTPLVMQHLFSYVEMVDWKKTKAFVYPMPFPSAGIVINTQGRQPLGIVTPGREYEALRSALIEQLYTVVDPHTGQAVVESALRREDIYQGQYLERAPDIVFLTTGAYEALQDPHRESPDLFSSVDEATLDRFCGVHRMEGIFLAYGEQFCENKKVENLSIVDVAPLLLYAMDAPIPSDMDGTIPLPIFKSSYQGHHPVHYCPPLSTIARKGVSLSREEEESIKDKLRGLGYIR